MGIKIKLSLQRYSSSIKRIYILKMQSEEIVAVRDPNEQDFNTQLRDINAANLLSITVEQHVQNVLGLFFALSTPESVTSQAITPSSVISCPRSPTSHDVQHIVRSSIFFRVLLNFCRSLNCVEAVNITEEDAYLLQIAVMFQAASEQIMGIDTNLTAGLCTKYFIEMGLDPKKSKVITQFIHSKEGAGLLGDIIEHVSRLGGIRSMKTFKMDDLSLFRMAVANSQSGIFIQIISDVALLIAKQYELKESSEFFCGERVVASIEKTFQQSESYLVNDNPLPIKQVIDSTLNDIAGYLILNCFYNRNQLIAAKNNLTPVVSGGLRASLSSVATSSLDSALETDLQNSRKRKGRGNLTTSSQQKKKKNGAVQPKAIASSTKGTCAKQDTIPIDENSSAYRAGRVRGKLRRQENESKPKCVVPVCYRTLEAHKANYRAGFQKGLAVALEEFEADLKHMREKGYQLGFSEGEKIFSTLSPESILESRYSIPRVSAFHYSIYIGKYQDELQQTYIDSYSLGFRYRITCLFYAFDYFAKGFHHGQPVQLTELPFSFSGKFNPELEATLKQELLERFQEGAKFKLELTQSNQIDYQFAIVQYLINQIKELSIKKINKQNWGVLHYHLLNLHPELKENIAFIFRNHFINPYVSIQQDGSRLYCYDNGEQTEQQLLLIRLCIGGPTFSHLPRHSDPPHSPPRLVNDTHFMLYISTVDGLTRYHFNVTAELHNAINDLLFEASLAKSIRWDKDNFLEDFILSITKSPRNNHVFALRRGNHKEWTVCANGVFRYHESPPSYPELTPEEVQIAKSETSKHQSTSLIMSSQHIFGFDKERRDKLVGFIFKINNKLINRSFLYDGGTVNRPWEFDIQEQANQYYKNKINRTFFKSITELKTAETRTGPNSPFHYNEVLARLRWDINTSCVGIFSDTFEARCIAIFYAKILRKRLVAQYQELNKVLPDTYEVPIRYYLPSMIASQGTNLKHGGLYTKGQQQQDRQLAEKIYNDPKQVRGMIANKRVEFILLLEDYESLTIENVPLLIWFAAAQGEGGCQSKLTQLIYSQTSLPKYFPIEEYLKIETEKLLAKWAEDPEYKLFIHPLPIAKRLGRQDLTPEYMERKLKNTKELTALDRNFIIALALICGKECLQKLISCGLTITDIFAHDNFRGGHLTNHIEVLLELGADINVQCPDGTTILHRAVANNNLVAVEILLKHKPNLEIKDMKGNTPMHIAVLTSIDRTSKEVVSRHNKIIQCLLEEGADYLTANNDGLTARDIARNSNDTEAETMMQERRATDIKALASLIPA